MSHFSNQVIWVIGASGALGAATVKLLAAQGATVVASSRSIAPDAFDGHGAVHTHPLDVGDDAQVRTTAQSIVERHGRIDGLVVSANVAAFGEFVDLLDEDWERVVQTKLLGSVRAIRAVLPTFIAQKKGAIVALSGRGGIDPPPHHFPGATINAALDLLVQGLGRRYGPQGIRTNAVAPGPIDSPRFTQMANDAPGAATSAEIRRQVGLTALPGPGLPRDVAETVAFLLSDRAAFINGVSLLVDGGGPPYPA